MNNDAEQNLLIYHTADGRAAVSLYARDGNFWMSQSQLAELFATSVPNISTHISKILKDKELDKDSVVKNYLTTAADGKQYKIIFYALDMILAIGKSVIPECTYRGSRISGCLGTGFPIRTVSGMTVAGALWE